MTTHAPEPHLRAISSDAASEDAIVRALRGRGVIALTGAGMSTESGIPDYRSPESLTRRPRPIQGPEFVRSASVRQRYWARAMVGWEHFRLAKPCAAHVALAALEARRSLDAIITQNVDRLHHAAGSRRIVELHGALEDVTCLECRAGSTRDEMQARMRALNADWIDTSARIAPDGDAELPDELVETFEVPACGSCGGVLKPRVVFFGENVARAVVDEAYALVDGARALLVLGTG